MKNICFVLTVLALTFLAACGGASNNSNSASPGPSNAKPGNQPANTTSSEPGAKGEGLKIASGNSTLTFLVSRKDDKAQAGFTMFEGTFDLVNGKPEDSTLSIDADTGTLFCDNAKIADLLRSEKFLDVTKFPKASFKSTKIEAGARAPDNYTITGDLTIRDQTKPVTFPATIAITDADVTMKIGFRAYRKEFGLTNAGPSDDPIRDDFSIMLDVKVPRRK